MNAMDGLIEIYEEDQNDGEFFSVAEQERYESGIIEEARQIVAGKSLKLSTAEHLRVLLNWLDACDMSEAVQANSDTCF